MINTLMANVPLIGHLYLQHPSPTGASHIFYFRKSSTWFLLKEVKQWTQVR